MARMTKLEKFRRFVIFMAVGAALALPAIFPDAEFGVGAWCLAVMTWWEVRRERMNH